MQDLVKEAEKVFHKRETEKERERGKERERERERERDGGRRKRTGGIIDKREI